MVHGYILPDLCRFPDHHAHAMIDEEPRADLGPGVDFNSSEETAEVREKAAQKVEMVPPDPVGEAMEVDRMKTWVAEEYLNQASGRRISVEDGSDVSLQTAEQLSLQRMVPFRAVTELLLRAIPIRRPYSDLTINWSISIP